MVNNRDDKYDAQDDTEYHFSDEEVSYEVDSDEEKSGETADAKGKLLARLRQSKKLLVTAGVFLVVLFIVYRIVAPPSSPPITEITPTSPQVVAQQKPAVVENEPVQPAANPPETVQSAAPPTAPQAPMQAEQPVAQNNNLVQQQPVAQQQVTQQQVAQQQPMTQPVIAQQPPAVNQPVQQQAPQQVPVMPQPTQQAMQPPQQPVANMPNVMPVRSAPVTAYPQQPQALMSPPPPQPVMMDNNAYNRLQADYMQKMNDFAAQNKMLQDQMQGLNARVVIVESQLNQLIHMLMQQHQAAQQAHHHAAAMPAEAVKVSYNVQAIIPGRAWLRSDNGETVTVTEGEVVKGLGRVTKIDPYDGVVEINIGNKVISLSYGGGSG
jgi:hypothetical protein